MGRALSAVSGGVTEQSADNGGVRTHTVRHPSARCGEPVKAGDCEAGKEAPLVWARRRGTQELWPRPSGGFGEEKMKPSPETAGGQPEKVLGPIRLQRRQRKGRGRRC